MGKDKEITNGHTPWKGCELEEVMCGVKLCEYLEGKGRWLTTRPSVASPSSPPKVMTGDMQAQ